MAELTRLIADGTGEIAAVPGAPPLDAAAVRRECADETWALGTASVEIAAHASIWYRATPSYHGQPTGAIGHFAAAPGADARPLLDHLCDRLRAQGCSVAVGPMNGNTWRTYRFIVDRTDEPPFLLDLDHPPGWPAQFTAAGFTPIAEYESTLVADLSRQDSRVGRAAARLAGAGVRLRPLDGARAAAELRAIHQLTLAAFARAFLYTPIDEDEFLGMYLPLLPRVDPRLIIVAEDAGGLAGYVFAIPNLLEPARGEPLRTAIVKTLAIRPERAYAGLGAWLVAEVQAAAAAVGFTRAIHALMHVSNVSRALSEHWQALRIRRYEIYARELAGG